MTERTLRYDKMVEDALRGVVRASIACAADHGLPGSHHFYVTFRTTDPGVELHETLRRKFPQEMTIVLQHQFWDLRLSADAFHVSLSFGGVARPLTVPFAAITAFFDPSVQFGLKFEVRERDLAEPAGPPTPGAAGNDSAADDESGGVVTLDAFRKK
ncbi:MAG: SspB family protein [Geminicoccales bacterium]